MHIAYGFVPAGFLLLGASVALAKPGAGQRRDPQLDSRRYDAGDADPGEPRPFRAGAQGLSRDDHSLRRHADRGKAAPGESRNVTGSSITRRQS